MTKRPNALRSLVLAISAIFMVAALIGSSSLIVRGSAAAPVGQKGFNPEGQFNPLGTAPSGLQEVASINLYRSGRGRSFMSHSYSGLYTTRGTNYKFKTINATRQSLVFTTRAVKGTSYSFKGRFLRGGVFAELDSSVWDQPILEGTLTKLRNGKKVAEGQMRFSYFGGT
jgi:hypothetical protein